MSSNIIFLIVFALLHHSCLATIETNNERNDLQSHPKPSNGNRKVNVCDLNRDVLFYILESVEVIDMLNLVDVCQSEVFSSVATSIFWRKYRKYDIHLWTSDSFNHGKIQIYQESEIFEVNDFCTSLQLIKYVGNAFERLEIKTQFISAAEGAVLNQNMDKYAGDSLIHLDLGPIKADTFSYFTVPLEKVEELFFKIQFRDELRSDVLPLNYLFPTLRRLKIQVIRSNVEYGFINCELKNLEYLHMEIDRHRNDIEGLIRKNPQICEIVVITCPQALFEVMGDFLPELEDMTLGRFIYGNNPAKFKRVKRLVFNDDCHSTLENLQFPLLKSLEMQYQPKDHDAWMNFFRNHKHLTRLQMKKEQNGQLTELLSVFSNLTDLTLHFTDVDVPTIQEIIANHENLKKLQISHYSYFDQAEWTNLQQYIISQHWEVKSYRGHSGKGFSFEKRN